MYGVAHPPHARVDHAAVPLAADQRGVGAHRGDDVGLADGAAVERAPRRLR